MIRHKLSTAALAGCVGLAMLPLTAHADVSRASVLASTCFACHGTDGKSEGTMPSIYGYPAEIMISHMKAFSDGTRAATVMNRHALGYTEEEIKLIAGYLSQVSR